LQPRRTGNPERDSTAELCRPWKSSCHFKASETGSGRARRTGKTPAGSKVMSAGTQQVPMPWTPAPPQLVMAYSVCKGITRTAAKNFYYAFLVLPRRKREALCAVYAFMRRCDDIADDSTLTLPGRRQKLDLWLDALHRAQQGEPTDDAILLALTDAQRRF